MHTDPSYRQKNHCQGGETGVASPDNLKSGKVDMKDYVLNKKPEPASNEMVWAFDLGKGSIGEAVRRGNEFLHKASLLIPAEFAETKTAAVRRRMWRTRQPGSKEALIGAVSGYFSDPDGYYWEVAWNPVAPLDADGFLKLTP
jgi:hypothetical protein